MVPFGYRELLALGMSFALAGCGQMGPLTLGDQTEDEQDDESEEENER